MKKEQEFVNSCVEKYVADLEKLMSEHYAEIKWKRLYKCTAEYCRIDNTYILRSYNTIVAAFDVSENMLFDFLRYVYGYTATSSQHIAKFRNFVFLENVRTLNRKNYTEWRWQK